MLFTTLSAPALKLRNRVVMAPMTRSQAVEDNTPNALMAEYDDFCPVDGRQSVLRAAAGVGVRQA